MTDMDWQAFGAEHPGLLLLAVFLTAFAESLAFIGLVVPGVVMLVVLAGAAQWAGVSVWLLLSAGFFGALIGDVLSFYWGAHRREGIWAASYLKRYQPWLQRGTVFFERWGWASILVGRFVGPVRPVMPAVAGVLGMSARRFWVVDLLACVAWAPVYLLPGYLAGQLVDVLPEVSWPLFVLLLIGGSALALMVYFLQAPQRWSFSAKSVRLLGCSLAVLLLLLTLGAWLRWWPVEAVHIAIAQSRLPMLTRAMQWITQLGDAVLLAPFGVCVGVILAWRFSSPFAIRWLGQLCLGLTIYTTLKWVLGVPRPELIAGLSVALPNGPSDPAFPSGHTWMSWLMWLGLVMWVPWPKGRARQSLIVVAGLIAVCISCSRLYLGVHWWPDVMAGATGAFLQALLVRHYVFGAGVHFRRDAEGKADLGVNLLEPIRGLGARNLALVLLLAWSVCVLVVTFARF